MPGESQDRPPPSGWNGFERMDEVRRWQGRWLDQVGLGPVETPFRTLLERPSFVLRAYGDGNSGPALLIVPAPIKRPYIWDLTPEVSVVRRCLEARLRVFMVAWTVPGPRESRLGLDDYADRLIGEALDTVTAETGEERALMAGHSLGGTLAAIYASLHAERLRALVLLDAPLRFGEAAGDFAPLIAAAPDIRPATTLLGNVPGSVLNLASVTASPATYQWARWMDWLSCLSDPEALCLHARVERWAMDESPLPGRLFEEVVELLYREDRFARGTLDIGGRQAGPDGLAMPLLTVYDPRSRVFPPDSILPVHDAAPGPDKRLLRYEGDRGVSIQHVGVLVGRSAHQRLWPEILAWLRARR